MARSLKAMTLKDWYKTRPWCIPISVCDKILGKKSKFKKETWFQSSAKFSFLQSVVQIALSQVWCHRATISSVRQQNVITSLFRQCHQQPRSQMVRPRFSIWTNPETSVDYVSGGSCITEEGQPNFLGYRHVRQKIWLEFRTGQRLSKGPFDVSFSPSRIIGHAVAQLVEALRYKPEGPRFDSRRNHWNFSLT